MQLDRHLPTRLAERLCQSLPGRAAQAPFAPQLCYGRHHGPPAHDVRRAAVLVLLFADQHDWRIPFTLRPKHLPAHGGQVSFPGGELDAGETVEDAARRELQEELNVEPAGLTMLGHLSPIHVFGSNYLVTPCVAAVTRRPAFVPNPDEVASLLEPTLAELADPDRRGVCTIHRRSIRFEAPCIECHGERIWGATSMMLVELLALLDESKSQ